MPPTHQAAAMETPSLKKQAHDLIDKLPDSATWDDVAYEIELRASVERGLADSKAGRVMAVEDLMKEFGVEG
jgi:predicted transcriptional regulator